MTPKPTDKEKCLKHKPYVLIYCAKCLEEERHKCPRCNHKANHVEDDGCLESLRIETPIKGKAIFFNVICGCPKTDTLDSFKKGAKAEKAKLIERTKQELETLDELYLGKLSPSNIPRNWRNVHLVSKTDVLYLLEKLLEEK